MKETPILMCGDMVCPTLKDIKTETRRVVKPQPPTWATKAIPIVGPWQTFEGWHPKGKCGHEKCACIGSETGGLAMWTLKSPYGQPGDRIWVKETHWRFGQWVKNGFTKSGKQRWRFSADRLHKSTVCFEPPHVKPKPTSKGWHTRPSIFMPRWASRITLEITGGRVERVQDITEAGAKAEGVPPTRIGFNDPRNGGMTHSESYIETYGELWDSLNAKRDGGKFAWEKNPWVWVVQFKRVKP